MTQTVHEWAERAATLPAALVEATPRAVVAGARALDVQVTTNLRIATGGDMRLSGVRSRVQITTRVRTRGSGSRTRAEVVPAGPIMLIEANTRAHPMPRQTLAQRTGGSRGYSMARRRSASRRGFMHIPGVGFRASAMHPGTKGKRPVRRAFRSAADEAGRAGMLVFRNTIRQHLGS